MHTPGSIWNLWNQSAQTGLKQPFLHLHKQRCCTPSMTECKDDWHEEGHHHPTTGRKRAFPERQPGTSSGVKCILLVEKGGVYVVCWHIYYFPKAAEITTNLMAWNNRHVFSRRSGGWESEIKRRQGCALSQASRARSFLASTQLLMVADNPHTFCWRHMALVSASTLTWSSPCGPASGAKFPSSYRDRSHWIGTHYPVGPDLN